MKAFPVTPEAKKAAAAAMRAAAPGLMEDVAAIRAMFPTARMTYFSCPTLELGAPARPGWDVDDQLMKRAAELRRKKKLDKEALELETRAKRQAKNSSNKLKAILK